MADLLLRRTATDFQGPAELDEWIERLRARHPWLDDEDDDGERAPPTVAAVSAGLDPRRADLLWIIGALADVDEAVERGEDSVRGVACRRWAFHLDRARVGEPQERSEQSLRRGGEAWIDGDGRLRRVTSSPLTGRRTRRPGRPVPRTWESVELWDFGVLVEIELPVIAPRDGPPLPIALAGVAWKLLRQRRAYRRRVSR